MPNTYNERRSRFRKRIATNNAPTQPKLDSAAQFQIEGRFVFTRGTTQEQFREFLWAGLRFLNKEAEARGLSDDEKNRLLCAAFDCFHGVADDMWSKLKNLITSPEVPSPNPEEEVFVAQPASIEAMQDDKPSPVEFSYVPELDLLDPDADAVSGT